jgi:hypothetical protein
MSENRKIAEEIANNLFTNGSNEVAERLVLELSDKRDGGGLARGVVIDRVEEILSRACIESGLKRRIGRVMQQKGVQ